MANREAPIHLDTVCIRYFFVKNRIAAGEVVIEHMGTELMLEDGMTKPLEGELFRRTCDYRNKVGLRWISRCIRKSVVMSIKIDFA